MRLDCTPAEDATPRLLVGACLMWVKAKGEEDRTVRQDSIEGRKRVWQSGRLLPPEAGWIWGC